MLFCWYSAEEGPTEEGGGEGGGGGTAFEEEVGIASIPDEVHTQSFGLVRLYG